MLEKPDIQDEKIVACLQNEYGLVIGNIAFLPLGADMNTAVYRAVTVDEKTYFVKLRRGDFVEASVAVPKYLSDLGIKQIISSLPTQTGRLWANLPPFKMILYPFVVGRNGYERNLSDQHWIEFGTALKQFHTADIPSALTNGIKREAFLPRWRETVKLFLTRIEDETFVDPVAAELAAFLSVNKAETLDLVARADAFARTLQTQPPDFILCHADIHAWNLLIDDGGTLYMVDWDTLIFAPKERDLMFVGGGLGGHGRTPQEEERLFYQGYGQAQVDPLALAYYRYERIIEDIALSCEQIFLSDEGGKDRKRALACLKSNYLPDGMIEIARRAEQT